MLSECFLLDFYSMNFHFDDILCKDLLCAVFFYITFFHVIDLWLLFVHFKGFASVSLFSLPVHFPPCHEHSASLFCLRTTR